MRRDRSSRSVWGVATTSTDRREQAVNRSLDRARGRAEERLQRLMEATEQVIAEGGDVTVQEVVTRAGQSLRTFYQHFAGKDELLLALLEAGCDELATALERAVGREADPLAALRSAVVLLHKANGAQRSQKRRALAQFSAHLLHTDAAVYQQVQQRIVDVLVRVVAEAVPSERNPRRTAAVVLNVIQGAARRDALLAAQGLRPMTAEEIWASVHGLVFTAVPDRAA